MQTIHDPIRQIDRFAAEDCTQESVATAPKPNAAQEPAQPVSHGLTTDAVKTGGMRALTIYIHPPQHIDIGLSVSSEGFMISRPTHPRTKGIGIRAHHPGHPIDSSVQLYGPITDLICPRQCSKIGMVRFAPRYLWYKAPK